MKGLGTVVSRGESERPSARPSHSNLSQTAVISPKRAEMDELLEKAILNVKFDKSLTERETEILKSVIAGNTNKKIAQEIYKIGRWVYRKDS